MIMSFCCIVRGRAGFSVGGRRSVTVFQRGLIERVRAVRLIIIFAAKHKTADNSYNTTAVPQTPANPVTDETMRCGFALATLAAPITSVWRGLFVKRSLFLVRP